MKTATYYLRAYNLNCRFNKIHVFLLPFKSWAAPIFINLALYTKLFPYFTKIIL